MTELVPDALAHADWLERLAEELVGDASVAHDLAMDACGVLAKRQDPVHDVPGFLRGVVRKLALRHRRGEERRRHRESLASRSAAPLV